MFGNIFGETFEVTFEVFLEDKMINRQVMQAPKEMLIINFMQTVDQVGKDKRPIRVRMYRPETLWDKFEQKEKIFNHEVEFLNNAMIAWQEDKEHEQKGGE